MKRLILRVAEAQTSEQRHKWKAFLNRGGRGIDDRGDREWERENMNNDVWSIIKKNKERNRENTRMLPVVVSRPGSKLEAIWCWKVTIHLYWEGGTKKNKQICRGEKMDRIRNKSDSCLLFFYWEKVYYFSNYKLFACSRCDERRTAPANSIWRQHQQITRNAYFWSFFFLFVFAISNMSPKKL